MFTFIWSEDFFGIPVGVQSTPQEDFVNIVELNNFEYKKRDTCKYLDRILEVYAFQLYVFCRPEMLSASFVLHSYNYRNHAFVAFSENFRILLSFKMSFINNCGFKYITINDNDFEI